jgi:hypothetical protein
MSSPSYRDHPLLRDGHHLAARMVARLTSICDLWSFEPNVRFGGASLSRAVKAMAAVCALRPSVAPSSSGHRRKRAIEF